MKKFFSEKFFFLNQKSYHLYMPVIMEISLDGNVLCNSNHCFNATEQESDIQSLFQ